MPTTPISPESDKSHLNPPVPGFKPGGDGFDPYAAGSMHLGGPGIAYTPKIGGGDSPVI